MLPLLDISHVQPMWTGQGPRYREPMTTSPSDGPSTDRKPISAYTLFLVVLGVLVLVLIPPTRLIAGVVLLVVFAAIGVAYAIIWARIWIVRRRRRRVRGSRPDAG